MSAGRVVLNLFTIGISEHKVSALCDAHFGSVFESDFVFLSINDFVAGTLLFFDFVIKKVRRDDRPSALLYFQIHATNFLSNPCWI